MPSCRIPTADRLRDQLNAALADRYLIERELGRGGMATVWLARDLRHDRMVALKVLEPELAGAIGVERFLRGVRLTARLQHPNIVPVLDSGVVPGPDGRPLPWFTMTYVAGESLRQRLDRERQLPIEDATRIAEAAASALAAAHSIGVVHRDIKPENLLLLGDHTYVADFGIAKAVLDTEIDRLTGSGVVVGTPAYMSPEQATNDILDERSDQYALATVVYEMLAGEPPFTGATAQAIVARRLSEPARSIRPVRTTVPAPVEAAVLRALERVPADRFGSVSDFAAALRAPDLPRATASKSALTGRRVVVFATALLVVAAAATLLLVRRPKSHVPSPDAQAAYQRGMQNYSKRTPTGAVDAMASFDAAIGLDSAYSEAWAGLAKTYIQAYSRGFVLPGVARDGMPRLALSALERSIAADPHNADVWVAKGIVLREIDPTDPSASLRSFQQAVKVDSTLAQAWQRLGTTFIDMGRSDDALVAIRKSVTLDPAYTEGLSFMALAHYWRRQYDSASHWADSAVSVDEAYLLARQAQGYIAVEQGNFARATAAFTAAERVTTDLEFAHALAEQALVSARAGRRPDARRLLIRAESIATRFSPTVAHTAIYMAQPYAVLGDVDRAIAWLRRYTPANDAHFQTHMRCDPPFDPIADDPRFRSLLITPRPTAPRGC